MSWTYDISVRRALAEEEQDLARLRAAVARDEAKLREEAAAYLRTLRQRLAVEVPEAMRREVA